MAVKVGLCGFSMASETYYETFPVVEIQHTFYEPPAIPTLERWRAQRRRPSSSRSCSACPTAPTPA